MPVCLRVQIACWLPELHLTTDLAVLLQACAAELQHQYGTPGGSVLSDLGGAFAVALVTRFAACFSLVLLDARRSRRQHLRGLALVSPGQDGSRVMFVDHDAPLVYCLPGRSGRVVVTEGAARLLSQEELSSVLAAERISDLAEMHADDAAGREQRPHLATALLRLVGCPTPAGALGAGCGEAVARIVRLSRPDVPLSRVARFPSLWRCSPYFSCHRC